MSEDRDLQKAVLAEFEWEPALTAAHIGVAADHGVVTLTGTVPHYLEKRAAESAAARVKGVKAVAEELKVHLPGTMKRDDSEIARAAIDRLLWETTVPADSIKIKVEEGWVTLRGEVEWHYQKKAAERMVRGLMGVVGVSNMTTIKPRVDADNIRHSIDEALHRSWFDPDKVNVEADGGKVTLSGTVHTPADRYKAGLMAWAAPGATAVENDLVVAD
jgi:osmotically-inducible protein OsmY